MIRLVLDRFSFSCLAVLVVVPAWLFGGIQASTQCWLLIVAMAGVLAATLCRQFVSRSDECEGSLPWLVYAVIGAIAWGALQLVALPPGVVENLSPTASSWWSDLAVFPPDVPRTLSVFPAGTRKDMSTLALILLAMTLASFAVNTSPRRLMLCAIVAANGAVMAFFGIVQQLTSRPGTIYWSVPLTLGGYPFAGFVNRNNAAGFLNMCLGLSFGFLLWSVTRYSMSLNPAGLSRHRRSRRPKIQWREVLASLDTVSILAMTATVFIAAGVLSTLSRGAALSLLGAAVITMAVAARVHRGLVGFGPMVCVATVGLGLAIWLGHAELLHERFSVLFEGELSEQKEGRLLHWQDALGVFRDFPLAGTGMGTYRFAYEPYETRAVSSWYVHAENQYIESAVEGGVIGFSLLLVCIALAAWSCYRLFVTSGDSETSAFGFGAVFVLTSQVLHAVFDFGLYMPSNAILLAAVCGVTGSYVRWHDRIGDRWFVQTENWLAIVVALLICAAGILGLREMRASSLAEESARRIRLLDTRELQSPEVVRSHIQQLHSALVRRPDDADGRYRLAKLWTTLYQVEAVSQIKAKLPNFSDEELLAVTSLESLFYRAQDPENCRKLSQQPLIKNRLGKAWRHLQMARMGCPSMSRTHRLMAKLSPLFDSSNQAQYIANAWRTSPGDSDSLYEIGLLKLYSGQTDEAIGLWRKCLTANRSFRRQMITIGTRILGPVEFYRRLLAGKPAEIVEIATTEYRSDQNTNLRLELASLAERELLRDQDGVVDTPDHLLGAIHVIREDWPAAIESYTKALEHSPHNLQWRYELAKAYLGANRLAQAKTQAAYGRQMGGASMKKFQNLIDQIDRRAKNQRTREVDDRRPPA